MSKLPSRVALITIKDPNDLSSWSGTQYRIYQQLLKEFDLVEPLGPVEFTPLERFVVRASHRILRTLFKKYNHIHSLIQGYFRAKHFGRKVREGNYSLVFASACSPVVAFLQVKTPIIYLSDATFDLLVDYYEQFSGLPRVSLIEGGYAEQRAIDRAALVILSSEWARQSAILHYKADPDKVRTCLFGANIDGDAICGEVNREKSAEMEGDVKLERIGRHCDLLFLARDWRRKGGTVALEAFKELRRRGLSASLTVCGCVPEKPEDIDGLTVIPYLDKGNPADLDRYHELMRRSHFLILPTVADCTPMVFAEANAYSMPVITTNTGGIPSIINAENGVLLPVEADGRAYADVVQTHFFQQPEQYRNLVQSSRSRYEKALNWDSWGKCVREFADNKLLHYTGTV